jgi:hypothetical protein
MKPITNPVTNSPATEELPPSLKIVPTIYPASSPIEDMSDQFWEPGCDFDSVEIRIEPPEQPLALLERLGPSPFPRGGFPLIGFLATTYDKVSRYAQEVGKKSVSCLQPPHDRT